jgi:hypothetical protein
VTDVELVTGLVPKEANDLYGSDTYCVEGIADMYHGSRNVARPPHGWPIVQALRTLNQTSDMNKPQNHVRGLSRLRTNFHEIGLYAI